MGCYIFVFRLLLGTRRGPRFIVSASLLLRTGPPPWGSNPLVSRGNACSKLMLFETGWIYFIFGQDSVNVALAGGDLELAKLAVRQVPQAAECKKRQLWRRIAEVAVRVIQQLFDTSP